MYLSQKVVNDATYPPTEVADRQHILWDSELKRFGLRVYPTGRKVFLVRYRTHGGRRRYLQLGDASVLTAKKARAMAAEALAQVTTGDDPADNRSDARQSPTVAHVCERFLEDYAKVHRKTWKQDEVMLGRVNKALGALKANEVTGADVAGLHRELGEKYGPRSANKTLNLVRRAWNVAIDWGILEGNADNPAARVKRFPERSRDRWLSAEELSRLVAEIDAEAAYVPKSGSISESIVAYLSGRPSATLDEVADAIEHPRDRLVILLSSLVQQGRLHRLDRGVYAVDPERNKWGDLRAIYIRAALWLYLLTGCRKSELLGARWADVDLARGELRLPETKNGEPARVPLSDPAVNILRSLPRLHENPFVFPGARQGQPLANIWKRWDRIRRRAGLADVRLHDLRRTVGSWLASSGNSILVVQQALHHKSYSAALIYARLSEDPVRSAMEEHGRAALEAVGARRANRE